MKALLIAEKPSLMKEIQKVYEKNKVSIPYNIDFLSFAGHIMGLKAPKEYDAAWSYWSRDTLPMIPKKFTYEVKNQKLFDKIHNVLQKNSYEVIINACDAGREGQLIFWSFLEYVSPNIRKADIKVLRLWANDVTEKGILKALNSLIDEKMDNRLIALTASSKLRAVTDWLIGMNLSRAVCLKYSNIKSIGRVKTPITKIIVDKELEIKNFKSEKYYFVEVQYDNEMKAKLYDEENKMYYKFTSKKGADEVLQSIGKIHIVKEIVKNKKTKYSPGCHSLSMLQIEANKSYGYTMNKTLEIAQSLYEKKILSYPRTDSGFLTEEVAKELPKSLLVLKSFSSLEPYITEIEKNMVKHIKSLLKNKKYVDNSKVADHYGIIPTGEKIEFDRLNKDEINILSIIAKRLVSLFLPPLVQEATTIYIENTDAAPNLIHTQYLFSTNGIITIDDGFSLLYKKMKENELPVLKSGDNCNFQSGSVLEQETVPPKRYTDATLNELLENIQSIVDNKKFKSILKNVKGLGTPATRGQIIEDLVKAEIIVRKGKSFFATEKAIKLIENIQNLMIASPILTAEIEGFLNDIEQLKSDDIKLAYQFVIQFVQSSILEIDKLEEDEENAGNSTMSVIGKCPICGSNVLESEKAYFCQNSKSGCFSIAKTVKGAKIGESDIKDILANKQVKKNIETKNGNTECYLGLNKISKKLEFYF